MTPEEFAQKLESAPIVEPDAIDLYMINDASKINDDSAIVLEDLQIINQ